MNLAFCLEWMNYYLWNIDKGKKKLSIDKHERKVNNYEESMFTIVEFPTGTCSNPIPFVSSYLNAMKLLNKPQKATNLVFPKIKNSSVFRGTKASCSDYNLALKISTPEVTP